MRGATAMALYQVTSSLSKGTTTVEGSTSRPGGDNKGRADGENMDQTAYPARAFTCAVLATKLG